MCRNEEIMELLEIFKAILFGIVEGITEWLPISSTGHLILLEHFFGFNNVSDEFWSMFEVVIQLGAIIAVVILFWNKLWPFKMKKLSQRDKRGRRKKKPVWKKGALAMWIKIIIACIPAAILSPNSSCYCTYCCRYCIYYRRDDKRKACTIY